MKISVTVKARQKTEKISQVGKQEFILWVKAPAKEGKANRAVIDLVSSHLRVAKSRCSIIHGHKHKNKIINVV